MAIAAAAQGVGVALESTRLAAGELARGELVVLGGARLTACRGCCTISVPGGAAWRARIAAFQARIQAKAAK